MKYFLLILILLISVSCNTGIEPSPDPGIIKITLQSNPADTSIIIVTDTLSVAPGDSFGVSIFQGKVFADSISAILYKDLKTTFQMDLTYNIIKLENGIYKKYTIFQSFVPPGKYTGIQFGIESNIIKFSGFDEIKVETPDEARFVNLEKDFTVSENKTTEIDVQISPFNSVNRYRDIYQFKPLVEIVNVSVF